MAASHLRQLLLSRDLLPPVQTSLSRAGGKKLDNISTHGARSGTGSDSESTRKVAAAHIPPIPIRDSAIRHKFPGLERRKFALPQRYETLNDSDDSQVKVPKKREKCLSILRCNQLQATFTRRNSLHDINIDKQKIGYFTATATTRFEFPWRSKQFCLFAFPFVSDFNPN